MVTPNDLRHFEVNLDTGNGEVRTLQGLCEEDVTIEHIISTHLVQYDTPEAFQVVSVRDVAGTALALTDLAWNNPIVYATLGTDRVTLDITVDGYHIISRPYAGQLDTVESVIKRELQSRGYNYKNLELVSYNERVTSEKDEPKSITNLVWSGSIYVAKYVSIIDIVIMLNRCELKPREGECVPEYNHALPMRLRSNVTIKDAARMAINLNKLYTVSFEVERCDKNATDVYPVDGKCYEFCSYVARCRCKLDYVFNDEATGTFDVLLPVDYNVRSLLTPHFGGQLNDLVLFYRYDQKFKQFVSVCGPAQTVSRLTEGCYFRIRLFNQSSFDYVMQLYIANCATNNPTVLGPRIYEHSFQWGYSTQSFIGILPIANPPRYLGAPEPIKGVNLQPTAEQHQCADCKAACDQVPTNDRNDLEPASANSTEDSGSFVNGVVNSRHARDPSDSGDSDFDLIEAVEELSVSSN